MKFKFIPILLLLGICQLLMAQDAEVPGDKSLPTSDQELELMFEQNGAAHKYQVEDFFKKPEKSNFDISPKGGFISFQNRNDSGKLDLVILDRKTRSEKVILKDQATDIFYQWINESKILFSKDKDGDENFLIYAINIDGNGLKCLTPFDDAIVFIQNNLEQDDDHILIGTNKDDPQVFVPYKLNINTGELTKQYDKATDENGNQIMSYTFTNEGELRILASYMPDGLTTSISYRPNSKTKFTEQLTIPWEKVFSTLFFNTSTPYEHDVIVMSNLNSDKIQYVNYDMVNNKVLDVIYENDKYDCSSILFSNLRNGEIDGVGYSGIKPTMIPISKTFKAIHESIKKEFNNSPFSIINNTDDEAIYLIQLTADTNPGEIYLMDKINNTFTKIDDISPQLKRKDLSEMQPIKYITRDDVTINGYLTMPKNKINKQVPLIIFPHGGPYGVRDTWGFNARTQVLASRGYAVLQVNYRGSGGYGLEFQKLGYHQIGRKMLDDLEDAVKHVVANYDIDPNRIGIFGGSYGGLATLGSLVKTPDLYKCGVDVVGVSNLFTFIESIPEYWKPFLQQIKKQWYDFDDPADQKIMKSVSPVFHVDKIKQPLLVIQGANDPRVNINESDQIVRELRAKGVDVPYLVRYDEGHGYQKESNKLFLWKCILGFLEKNL